MTLHIWRTCDANDAYRIWVATDDQGCRLEVGTPALSKRKVIYNWRRHNPDATVDQTVEHPFMPSCDWANAIANLQENENASD